MILFREPLELLILDVDGVIIDVLHGLQRDLERTARQVGLPLGPLQEFFAAVRAGDKFWHASLQDGIREFWPWLDGNGTMAFAWQFQDERRRAPWPLLAGSIEAIQWLREHGVPVALCTTNDQPTLERQFLAVGIDLDWFAALSTWESGTPKPDPRALDPIFKEIAVPREHSAYVGDWFPDLATAQGAGVRFIASLSGGIPRHEFHRKGVPDDHIIERLADLPKLITE